MLNTWLLRRPFAAVAFIWLAALLLAWPVGEFPLDDDWAYALSARRLAESGQYRVNDWPAMTLWTQVLWGALFAKIFGFSFWALRLSTLVLAVLGLAAFDRLLKGLAWPDWQRALALALLAFNPLFFELSATYMTDVPFVSLLLMTSWCYWQALRGGRWYWWALALLGAALSVLLRQPGLLLPVAFAAGALLTGQRPRYIGLAALSVALSYASLKGYVWWQESRGTLPAAFGQAGQLPLMLRSPGTGERIAHHIGSILLYLGLFLLPALLLLPRRRPSAAALFFVLPMAGAALWALGQVWGQGTVGNTIYNLGLGTVAMPGRAFYLEHFEQLPAWAAMGLSAAGAGAGLWLSIHSALRLWAFASRSFQRIRERAWPARGDDVAAGRRAFKIGIALFLAAYACFLLPNYNFFDRYLLPLLAFFLLLLPKGEPPGRLRAAAALAVLAVMAAFSVAGTHDYFSWNRARWSALHSLLERGVSLQEIDGGVEFNGWHETGSAGPVNPLGKSWWFIEEDTYAVAFKPYGNYEVVARFPYRKWLFPQIDTIYLLERPAWAGVDTLFYDMAPGSFDALHPFARFSPSDSLWLAPGREAGQRAFEMGPEQEYAFTHQFHPVQMGDELAFSFWMKPYTRSLLLINAAPDAKQFHYSLPLKRAKPQADGWLSVEAVVRVPPHFPVDTFSVYFWKLQPETVLLDDFRIIWRRAPSGQRQAGPQ